MWLGLELLLLLGLAALLARRSDEVPPVGRRLDGAAIVVVFCILLLWMPVQMELHFGQLNLILALLVPGAGCAPEQAVRVWRAPYSGQPSRSSCFPPLSSAGFC
jgi:hypothetical protein